MRSARTSSGTGVSKGILPSINRHCSGKSKDKISSNSEARTRIAQRHEPSLNRLDIKRRSHLLTFSMDHPHNNKAGIKGNTDGQDEFEEIIYLGNEEDELCTRALAKLAIAEEKPHADVAACERETQAIGLPFYTQPKYIPKNRGLSFQSERSTPFSERPRKKRPLSAVTESDKPSPLCGIKARRESGSRTDSELPRLAHISQMLCTSTPRHRNADYSSIYQSRRARAAQLEEYLKRIEKQYDIVEDKAKQVTDWLQTLEN